MRVCVEVTKRHDDGNIAESIGPACWDVWLLLYHDAYDALVEEFWEVPLSGWMLPLCEKCYKECGDGALAALKEGGRDAEIGFYVKFVEPICKNYPWQLIEGRKNVGTCPACRGASSRAASIIHCTCPKA
jgi:hypothetical protein